MTEALTHVIDHEGQGTPATVRLAVLPSGHTRVGVTDPDPRAPPLLTGPAGVTDESGRGLALLDAPAPRWGVEQRGTAGRSGASRRESRRSTTCGHPPPPAVRSGR
ncbi:ATP-binding protein [Streptomyces anthocyanicus]